MDITCAAFGKVCDENLFSWISQEHSECLDHAELDDEDCEWDDAALERVCSEGKGICSG